MEDWERKLLGKHAPRLRYDPQDAYRATSAATMTDAPCNRLVAADGAPIAGGESFADLGLATLAAYPEPHRCAEGDHLAAGPSPLQDAVAMQSDEARYPHCAYGRVVPRGRHLWLQYWLWYYDNPKTFLGRGRHEGDWELVAVKLRERDREPLAVTCSQHAAGEARRWGRVQRDGDHPVIYVAPFSHANYFEPGTRFYFPAADHPTDVGPALRVAVEGFGDWKTWGGRWGASKGVLMGWRPLRPLVKGKLGGESPQAPIRQRQRWRQPDRYHAGAQLRKPIGGAKRLLWAIGKATFPLPPRLEGASRDGAALTVAYSLPAKLLRRPRHLLLTVHARDDRERMLYSRVVRKARREGEATLHLPATADGPLKLYASAFNALGQRSDLDSTDA